MKKFIKFGEDVEGYSVPVLNEREIRASAGIFFLGVLLSFILIIFKGNFLPVKYFITIFLTDLCVRVFVNPRFAPSLIIGRLIVSNQVPEYVGAPQKRFAWMIGLVLASTMFVFLVIVNAYSPITGITCLICLIFLFFETAFGICLGCKLYSIFYKKKARYCAGEVCAVQSKQTIQKTSGIQLFIVLAFTAYIILIALLLNDQYSKKPHNLFGTISTTQLK